MTNGYYIDAFMEVETIEVMEVTNFAVRELKKAHNFFTDKSKAIEVAQKVRKVLDDAYKE